MPLGARLAGEEGLESDLLVAFLDAGYTKENALKVITQVAYPTMANLAANLADTTFEPQARTAE